MKAGFLSETIRKRRLELGLSLADLARRVQTSAATVSRYESGWQRFEVSTLNKIAQALGCCLTIDLTPVKVRHLRTSPAAAARRLRKLFWDRELRGSDFRRYPVWVTERVLEYGSLEEVRVLAALMGRRRFLQHVAASRFSSARTGAFWCSMLEMEGVACTKRSFPREAWPS